MNALEISLAIPAILIVGALALWIWWDQTCDVLLALASPVVIVVRLWQLWRGRKRAVQRAEWDRKL